jgi:anaerobic selenocysteine-containing dehydrogenase
MNPQDAAERDLGDGEKVRVFNHLGEVHCFMKIDPAQRRGVVCLPKGLWRRATLNGKVGCSLVPDDLTPVSSGACFNDARVEVAKFGVV